jgi:ABC-2 type transport system ATP-binding protein
MIEVQQLTKYYGSLAAVRDVSFEVKKGDVVGFLGPNGAGKSTTLRILAGFLGATSGEVRVNGQLISEEPLEVRASIGYMPETSPLYPEMRVREYLSFRAELKGVRRKQRKEHVERAMRDAGLDGREGTIVGELSKGYRQRVGLADALVANPPLLILDEPTAGLDPNQIREVRGLVKRLSDEHTILLSTHILSEVEATCTRGLVISKGKLVAQGSIDELRELRQTHAVRFVVRGELDRAQRVLEAGSGVDTVVLEERAGSYRRSEAGLRGFVVQFEKSAAIDVSTEELVRELVRANVGVIEVASTMASLEQVFSELTSEAGDPARPPAKKKSKERARA